MAWNWYGNLGLKAAVSFHGILAAPDYATQKSHVKVLVAHGWDDPMAEPDSVVALGHELTDAGCDWQIHAYGQTTHAFTVPGTDSGDGVLKHNEAAERRSWAATVDLLGEVFAMRGVNA